MELKLCGNQMNRRMNVGWISCYFLSESGTINQESSDWFVEKIDYSFIFIKFRVVHKETISYKW
mgnify:CR=1 FL=1